MPTPLPRLAVACSLVLALGGCTGTASAPGQTDAAQPGRSAATHAKPSPSPTNQGVRKVSLADAPLVDVLRAGSQVQLAGGRATDGDFTYVLGDGPVFSDADGDGHEDVLAFIARTKGDTTITYGYVWLYDPAKKTVTQVADPVGDWNPCGDTLVEARPGMPSGFELAERLRDVYDHQKCGTEPLHPRTRTVVVSEGRLVMTKPYLAYGGICYPTADQTSELPRPTPLRVFPDAAAPVVENATFVHTELPAHAERTWPDGWVQVSWLTDEMKADNAFWGVCGFLWNR